MQTLTKAAQRLNEKKIARIMKGKSFEAKLTKKLHSKICQENFNARECDRMKEEKNFITIFITDSINFAIHWRWNVKRNICAWYLYLRNYATFRMSWHIVTKTQDRREKNLRHYWSHAKFYKVAKIASFCFDFQRQDECVFIMQFAMIT